MTIPVKVRFSKDWCMRGKNFLLTFGIFIDERLVTVILDHLFEDIIKEAEYGQEGSLLQIVKQAMQLNHNWDEPFYVNDISYNDFSITHGEWMFWKAGQTLAIYPDNDTLRLNILKLLYRKITKESCMAVSDSEIISELEIPSDVLHPHLLFLSSLGYLDGGDQWHKLTAKGLLEMEPNSIFSKSSTSHTINQYFSKSNFHDSVITAGNNNTITKVITPNNDLTEYLDRLAKVIEQDEHEDKEIHLEAVEDAKENYRKGKFSKLKLALSVFKDIPAYHKTCDDVVQVAGKVNPDILNWWHHIVK